METMKIALFEGKKIRKTWYKNEWWFVIEDVVWVLTDSTDPKQYVKRMKMRDSELSKGWVQFVPTLDVITGGGVQKMACANTEGILRIIQSIPSPKAEPFKLWLARVGKERIDEIENPELAVNRAKQIYEKKGYSKDWIDKRLRGIAVRHSLTDEWRDRGVRRKNEY
ncbi:Bro-N domain-containing protein, partial [Candidatus Peregrinibacteria bacterium]|nr:Bro-N domain-containing protein [Candidatus Peregrinibacteria bacterium]